MRLEWMTSFCAALQRFSPMPSPARWTTPSTPASPAASIVPASGSQRTPSVVVLLRTMRTPSWPSSRRRATRAVPMRPDEPVTATRLARTLGELWRLCRLRRCSSSSCPQSVVEPAREPAIVLGGDAAGGPGFDVVDLAAVGRLVAGAVVAELVADLDEVAEGAVE